MRVHAWGCGGILYFWAVLAWCGGWRTATVAVLAPAILIFVWGFVGGMWHYWKVKRETARIFRGDQRSPRVR